MLNADQPSKHFLPSDIPYISVVVPVRCEFEGLTRLLPELMKQDYPQGQWEILIADGESTDQTAQLVSQFALSSLIPIKFLKNRGIRSSAGRNVGICAARGDIILFIDGHCSIPNRSLLSDTAQIFQQTNADCLCRPQPLSGSPAYPMSTYIAEVRRSTFGHGRGSMIYDLEFTGFIDPRSSGAAYRRSVFERIGLYDEAFDACEDVEFNTRVSMSGMQAYTDPKLAINYQARNSLRALAKQMVRYGRGRVRLARKHREERSLSSVAPMLLCLFVLVPLLFIRNQTLFLLASLPTLLYIATVFIATMELIARTRRLQLVWGFVIYPVIHIALGIGMLLETASRNQPTTQSWTNRQSAT